MEISKAILALISIAINLRGRTARVESAQAEHAAQLAAMQAKLDAVAPQTVDVPADQVAELTAAAGN